MSLVRPNELHIKGRMYEVAGRLRRGKSGDLVLQRRLMDASTPAAVLEIVLPNATKLGSVNYACALHRCAVWFRSGKRRPSGLSQVPRLALQTVRDWRAREAATITWALAVTRELDHILEFARLSMSCDEASGGDLANVVHSLTISGLNPRQCTATLAVVAKRVTAMDLSHSGVIEPKQLAAVFWGFVKLEFTDDDVMTYLVRSATARMDEFNSQDLSMVSWALAKSLPLLPTEGYHAAVQCCISKIALRASTVSLSSTQAVTNTLWALARCRQAGLVVPLRGVKMKPLKQRTSQNVANYLWSLCVLELPCPDQLELIDLITIAFTTRECCNVVWALAHWPEAADLAWSLLPRIIEESAQLSPLDIASLSKAVAMAVADSGAESLNRPMHVCF